MHRGPLAWLNPVEGTSTVTFYLRCLWVVVQLMSAYWFSREVSPFFYQQF